MNKTLLPILILILSISACKPDPILTISKSSVNSPSGSYNTTVTITSNTDWRVASADSWCQITPSTGSGNGTITLTLLPNPDSEPRSTVVTVVAGSLSSEISISQKQKNALILTRRTESVPAEGGTISVELRSNITYSVIAPISDTWVSISQTKSMSTYNYAITVAENNTLTPRSTIVIFKDIASALADTLTINQDIPGAVNLRSGFSYVQKTGGNVNVTLDYNSGYEYSIVQGGDWISIAETKAPLSTKSYTVSVNSNPTDQDRVAQVIFRLTSPPAGILTYRSDTLRVFQSGFDGHYTYLDGSSPLWKEIPTADRDEITRLKIEGSLNKNDIYTIRDSIRNVTFLDLEGGIIDTLPERAFKNLTFPSVLRYVLLPLTLKGIGAEAFNQCNELDSVIIPSGVKAIRDDAFSSCSSLIKVESKIADPFILTPVFTSINSQAHLVVPVGALVKYQSTPGWDYDYFYRIYEKGTNPQEYIKPGNYSLLSNSVGLDTLITVDASSSWEVYKSPSWITATKSGVPEPGLDLKIASFSGSGSRQDTVFLKLTGKSLTSYIIIKQHGLPFNDGHSVTLQAATVGNGVDIVIMGDGYTVEEISSGKYEQDMRTAKTHFFDIEPYRTYSQYFNVYMVYVFSKESGISDNTTTVNTALSTRYKEPKPSTSMTANTTTCFNYAAKAPIKGLTTTLVINVANSTRYGGTCVMYSDNKAVSICPKSTSSYPYDFRGVVQHEAAGHGFGKLADEYVTNNETIPESEVNTLKFWQSKEHYKNVDVTGDVNSVLWKHIASHSNYSSYVSTYQGGYYYSKGVWRPEMSSLMINNIRYINAPSREMIVKRIMSLAGETYTFENFVSKDVKETAAATKAGDYPVIPEMLLPPPILIR
ncbi:MAG: M64 family metallopeptidase [Bacteroidales bacterium]|nr:M64 family metallo-endopeptidase [Bacteroidales bacterium]MDD2425129.1 M64 family metallopeptidase [Bacteroidales bacterium]MDD3989450.1 M64 family metallopeptidase [Bacteroidales bacterium]